MTNRHDTTPLATARTGRAATALIAAALALGAGPLAAQVADHAALIDEGRAIFEAGLAGIPCASCHGDDPELQIRDTIAGRNLIEVHGALQDVAAMNGLVLTPEQMVAVTAYAASLQAAGASTTTPPSELVAQGRALFESGQAGVGCTECHGDDPTDLVGPSLGDVEAEAIHAMLTGLTQMRVRDLTAQEEAALAAYLEYRANQ